MKDIKEKTNLVLDIGIVLLSSGAHARRIKETVTKLANLLGMENVATVIQLTTLTISFDYQGNFFTRAKKVERHGVDMSLVDQISKMAYRAVSENYSFALLQKEFQQILSQARKYPLIVVNLAVAISCCAFCRIFGGNGQDVLVTFAASFLAFFLRHILLKQKINNYITIMAAAAIGTGFALFCVTQWDLQHFAVISNVLFLIPGVLLINSYVDILHDRPMIGIGRLLVGTNIIASIAIGMVIALGLFGNYQI